MEMKRSTWHSGTVTLLIVGIFLGAGCTEDTADREPNEGADQEPVAAVALPQWTFDSSMVFPGDGSLVRPEDGVVLSGGRLIVGDQVHGLRQVEPDGSSAPFGDMAAAGYVHNPPEHGGGPNGISLEPDGTHLLVADIFQGRIYRVDVETGAAEQVYQHRYGVNTAVRDSRGAIWFTQSAHNTPEEGEARMWANVDRPAPEGALLRLGFQDGEFAAEAEVMVDSLYFGNGVVIDEASGHLYVAETLGLRVLRYRVDLETGQLSERSVFVDGVEPDNLELDGEGHLWVALPLSNGLLVVDTETGERHMAFRSQTPAQQELAEEFARRGASGESRMELFAPPWWAPLPGLVTGVILSPDGGPVYLSGIGNALVRLPR
jgi:sugar lactone lactonase YvrE